MTTSAGSRRRAWMRRRGDDGRSALQPVEPSPLQLAISAIAGVGFWVFVRLFGGFPPGAWPGAGTTFVGPGAPSELVRKPDAGYDGQFVYRLAIDPFTTHATAHGITLYPPGYRQQRIMTALLAHVVSSPGISVAVAIIVVNALAVAAAAFAGVRLACDLGHDWRWGLLLAVPPCLPVSLAVDLTEPVEWAGVLFGILLARNRHWLGASVAFTIAVLSRETAAAIVGGYVIESIVLLCRRRESFVRARFWLLVPVVVETAWQLRLWAVWGKLPLLNGFDNTVVAASTPKGTDLHRAAGIEHGIPFFGIARTFLNGWITGDTIHPGLGVTYLVERIVLLAVIATAGYHLARRRTRIGLALTIAWATSAAIALSMAGWIDDIQFLRPSMEVWGLSMIALMGLDGRWPRIVVRAAAVVVAWEALFALVRT